MRTRAWAMPLATGGRSRGRAAVRVEGEADGWDLPVSVSQRGEKGELDERDPPVSDRLKEEARAAPAWAERGQAGLRAEFLGHSRHSIVFFFLFMQFLLHI